MRKRQLKRLEGKHKKMAIRIDAANAILKNIKDLKEAIKTLKNNPNAYVSIAVISGTKIMPLTDHIRFSNNVWSEIIDGEIMILQEEFKKL